MPNGTSRLLSRAIEIAASAHAAQVDKGGAPYVLHPLRMMMRQAGEAAMMAAVLHDVVEDTPWTLEALRAEGFPPEVLEAIACLTKREREDYADFIERAGANPIARAKGLGPRGLDPPYPKEKGVPVRSTNGIPHHATD